MLKLIYTETAVELELLTADLEEWVEQRLTFANSIGETMFLSTEKAAFLLPETVCEATAVNFYLYRHGVTTVMAHHCDLDRVEISLNGYWIANSPDGSEGLFITKLPDRIELYLWQLWCRANSLLVMSDEVKG